jgi:membrane dipeptidase
LIGSIYRAFIILFAVATFAAQQRNPAEDRARRLHADSIVVDTHIDDVTPKLQEKGWSFFDQHTDGHTDYPRLRRGGLDALFFSIYMPGTVTGPAAVFDSLERISVVRKLAEDYPDRIALCVTADQVRRAHREGKIAALMGVEGGHMINNSLPTLRMYADLGVRYLTLTHNVSTDWADSNVGPPQHGGLTEFGREVVLELNRLGVMVDISHVADATFWDTLAVSRAPLIASHSSCRAISGHQRNMTDEMIKTMAAKGGVIQITFVDEFLDDALYRYNQKALPLEEELQQRFPGRENAATRRVEIEKAFGPAPKVSWEKIIEHIDHAVKIAGVDHVGLGSDFDGAPMPAGMDDVSQLPKISEALLQRGYRESDLRKILGQNILRVLEESRKISEQMKRRSAGPATTSQ